MPVAQLPARNRHRCAWWRYRAQVEESRRSAAAGPPPLCQPVSASLRVAYIATRSDALILRAEQPDTSQSLRWRNTLVPRRYRLPLLRLNKVRGFHIAVG